MGWQTTVIFNNDALGTIQDDPDFTKKLVSAILQVRNDHQTFVNAYDGCCSTNGATVIESHHISGNMIISAGGLGGQVLGYGGCDTNNEEHKEAILKHLAESMGYTLRKKTSKKPLTIK